MTKEVEQLREVHAVQGREGCWDIDDYMLGLYNGLELALSIMENRAPIYKKRNKWVGLTDDEFNELYDRYIPTQCYALLMEKVEEKLQEKNS